MVKATDARGGAVWLVGQRNAEGQAEFQLAAQVEFESCGFQSDEVQRALKEAGATLYSIGFFSGLDAICKGSCPREMLDSLSETTGG